MKFSRAAIASPFVMSLVLAFVVGLTPALMAQVTSGSINGTVKDATGGVLPGATVTVSNPSTGVTRTLTTNDAGDFIAPNLPPGTYTIRVELQGFKVLEKSDVVLSATDRLNAGAFELELGGTAETVNVRAGGGELQLQANSGERSDLITGNQLNNLALNGRNIIDFVKVVPGVVSFFDGQVAGTGGIDAFNVNGTRANQHEFTIDGSSNVDTGNNGGTHVTLNPDAVAEMKILTANYQAEFGKAGGGQLVVTTKSGSRDFHGDARYFRRHDGLNANSWFANQSGTDKPVYRYNYFGYDVGGPVLIPKADFNSNRNRLFFFWSQEFYRQRIPVPGGLQQFRVPTELERRGDFSQTVDGNGNSLVIYNPATGQPFPGNKIDRDALTPGQQAVFDQVSRIFSLYSLPNVSGNNQYNFASQLSYDDPRREDILRLDYQLSTNHRVFGRWIHNSTEFEFPMSPWILTCMGQLQYPGGCTAKAPSWNLALNLVSTISPTLINEVTFGPSVTRSNWGPNGGNISISTNGINLPLLYPVTPDTNVPDFGFGGNENISYPWSYLGANPWFQANTTINVSDNLTKVINSHTLKGGVFFQRARKDQIAWGNFNGQVSFSNCATSNDPVGCGDNLSGNAYASALLGYFTTVSQSSSRPIGYFRYTNLEFYAQDTWKVNPRLTLDYGLRFAWFQPQYESRDQLAIFDPASYDPSKAVRLYLPAVGGGAYDPAGPGTILDKNLTGTIVPGSGDLLNGFKFAADGYYPGGWKDRGVMPEPRVGFAYALTGDNKTILRGGFGMMHDRIQGNLIFNPVFTNPRNVITPTVYNGNLADLAGAAESIPPLSSLVAAAPDGKVPTIYNYSIGVQRDVGWGTTIDVAYVGSVSRHLVTSRNLNQLPYLTAFSREAQDPSKYPDGVVPDVEPDLPQAYADAGFNYSGNYAFDPMFLVPYRGLGSFIQYYKFDGNADYHSLQVSVQRRFSKGLTFGAAYTFSRTRTTANADEDQQDAFDTRRYDYRLAWWDRPHVLVFNYVYDIPNVTEKFNGPTWLRYLTDNYQLSGITSFQSGAPIDTGLYWPPAWTINGTYNLWWNNYSRAYVYPTITADADRQVGTSKFDPAAFVPPPIGTPPTPSRDGLRGGGLQNWDMSLFKNIPLGSQERYLQLRFEAFNVFNHPNFQNVQMNWSVNPPTGTTPPTMAINTRQPGDTSLYGSAFGEYSDTYSGTGGPRVLQLAVKFYF